MLSRQEVYVIGQLQLVSCSAIREFLTRILANARSSLLGSTRRGMYEHSQKFAFGSRLGLHACAGLYADQGCGRTTRGNPQFSGRRSGVHSGNGTAPRLCKTGDLLGEGENRPDIRAGTIATINPEEYGKEREEKQKDGYIENPPPGDLVQS
jgi:hypothetical protein